MYRRSYLLWSPVILLSAASIVAGLKVWDIDGNTDGNEIPTETLYQ